MFTRPGKLSDKFVMPYENVKAAQAANGGAYPPDMSVLAKARGGGVDYIYSLLQGYEDPPAGVNLDAGVYYPIAIVGGNNQGPGILTVEWEVNGGGWSSNGAGYLFYNRWGL